MQPAPDLIPQFKALKLYGMATSYREIVHDALQKKLGPYELIASLLDAEAVERQTRSIAYQMQAAKFPVFRDLDSFQFNQASVNEGLIRELYAGSFIDETRNVVFVGGPDYAT